MCVPSRVVPPRGWGRATSCTAKSTRALLDCYVLRTGYQQMVPLGTYQGCSPAEDLQPSQGRKQSCAQRARRICCNFGTWNVRSMVDTESPVEVASRWADS